MCLWSCRIEHIHEQQLSLFSLCTHGPASLRHPVEIILIYSPSKGHVQRGFLDLSQEEERVGTEEEGDMNENISL